MEGEGREPELELDTLVGILRPDLRRVLWSHRIPAGSAVEVMRGALARAIELWDVVGDKVELLLAAAGEECLRYWQARGLDSPALCRPARLGPAGREVVQVGEATVDSDLLRSQARRSCPEGNSPVTRPRPLIRTALLLSAALTAAAVTAVVEGLFGKSAQEVVTFSSEVAAATLISASFVASAFFRAVLVRRSLARSLLLAVLALLVTYPLFAVITTVAEGHLNPLDIARAVGIVPVLALFSAPVALPATLVLAGAWYFSLSRAMRNSGAQGPEPLSPT
jgi:hypothetical protein